MGNRAKKGGAFERQLCRQLSEWWTNGARDDVFWRSKTSGARAKMRKKKGKDTAGQHGDIAATDPIGSPFTEVFTVEAKKGYSSTTIQDLLDNSSETTQRWEKWHLQAKEAAQSQGSLSWLLITKRDRREALVWMDARLDGFAYKVARFKTFCPVQLRISFRASDGEDAFVVGIPLECWLKAIPPELVRKVANERKQDARS